MIRLRIDPRMEFQGMAGARDLTADVDIDAAGLLAEIWKRKILVVGLTLLAGIALALLVARMEPRYQAGARVLIEQRESSFTRQGTGDFTLEGSRFDEQAIASQVLVLSSDDIALKVIEQLGLDRTEEFGAPKPSMVDRLLGALGLAGKPVTATPAELSLDTFKQHLTIYAAERSRVLVVEFWSHDPELARKVPNAVVDEYLALTKQAKLEANSEATRWLGPEIDDLRARVREAEAKVAEFRASADISIGSNNALLATQQLSEVSSELSRLRGERSAAEARAASIRAALDSGSSLDAVPEVLASPLIQRLRERQVALQAEISDLSTTLLPNHPRIRALRSQLGDFDAQIRSEARNILKGLESNAEVLAKQETALRSEIDRLKAESARVSEAEVGLRALEREAAAQRDLLQSYLTQYREAASRQASEYLPVDARIISRAVRPTEPYFPKLVPIVAAGMVTTLVLLVVGILAWALMTGRGFRSVVPAGMAVTPEMLPERMVAPSADMQQPQPASEAAGSAHPAFTPSASQAAELEARLAPDPRDAPVRPVPEMVFRKAADFDTGFDEEARDPGDFAAEPPIAVNDDPTMDDTPSEPRALPEVASPSLAAELPADDASAPSDFADPDFAPETFEFELAAQAIENLGKARIAVLSPAGDPGSAAAWMLARRLASHGRSVAVVDLTGSGVTGREMLGESRSPGLREFLSGAARFGDAIHRDRLTSVHVMPGGGGGEEPVDIDRLSQVVSAIADGYDYEIYDCGYAGADALSLVADSETIVIVSAAGAEPGEGEAMARELLGAGFGETILVELANGPGLPAAANA